MRLRRVSCDFGGWPYGATTFVHAAGAPFKALASFNFSLKFSKYRRWAVKKKRIAK
jgi:hypothetical protein